jgi:LmbE family N-acetylglucosaminyl deacetylase
MKFGFRKCAVIVAHPDDETLWAGGTILMNPQAEWKVVTLCRKSDPDRSPRFFRALEQLNAVGRMGDLDDGPEQTPLASDLVQQTILELLAPDEFDLIITHGCRGEYTRHLRHEETSKAVSALWDSGRLRAKKVWKFAYEDGDGKYLPRPIRRADLRTRLPENIWRQKYYIITDVYGFTADSFEAKSAGHEEAFRCCSTER